MSKSLRIARSILEMMLLLIAAGAGIVVAACVIITTDDFGGDCLLYGYVTEAKLAANNLMAYTVEWKGMANCRFIIIIQVMASIFALINVAVQGVFLAKRKIHGTSSVPLLFTGLYTISWTLVLVSSCILSAGFRAYCDSWVETLALKHISCRFVQQIQWNQGSSINGHRFYDVLSVAQTATWISFSVWVLLPLVAWAGVRFVSNRRHQDQASDVPT